MKDLVTVAVKPIDGLGKETYYTNCVYNEFCPILNKTLTSVTNSPELNNFYPIIIIFIISICLISIAFYVKKSLGGQSWKINA